MQFHDTITIYNVIPQAGRQPEKLKRTVIRNVYWQSNLGLTFRSDNRGGVKPGRSESRDGIIVHIPYSSVPNEMRDYPVLPGDFIVLGEHGDIDTVSQIVNSRCVLMRVTGVQPFLIGSRAMWHWEISGK